MAAKQLFHHGGVNFVCRLLVYQGEGGSIPKYQYFGVRGSVLMIDPHVKKNKKTSGDALTSNFNNFTN